ncbi:hypothetical protein [Buttiauxella ferragutiae]|uniref:hypothetical protein n=1 Tax=Buttiauxella ferragutiae TaxID=82989 RepID=UPI0035236680
MSYLKIRSEYNDHCIIQWYEQTAVTGSKQRNQMYFSNGNRGSQSITAASLELSHADVYYEKGKDNTRHRSFSPNSYKISPKMALIKKVPVHNTTDLFLYGHSTYRCYVHQKNENIKYVRGISVDGHYVSAAKVAHFLDAACSSLKKTPLRIWLLSCHTSYDDLQRTYIDHLVEKLKPLGWENKQIIGFDEVITVETLYECRNLASRTNLFAPLTLNSSKIKKYKPKVIKF